MAAFAAALVVASFLAYLFTKAHSMEEYVISAYFTTTLFGVFCSFLHTSTETATIFELIDTHIGYVIEKSKFEIE